VDIWKELWGREMERHQELAAIEEEEQNEKQERQEREQLIRDDQLKKEREEMQRRWKEQCKQERWQRENEAIEEAMKSWQEWISQGPIEEFDFCNLSGSLPILQKWLEKFEGFDSPEKEQFKRDLKEGITKGNEILKQLEQARREEWRRAIEEERIRKEAKKGRKAEEAKRGQNTGR
jgi:hypothetical protein